MKRLISLIISVSITMQVLTPLGGIAIYAQSNELTWERGSILNTELGTSTSKRDSTTALVSWDLLSSNYELEYYIDGIQEGQTAQEIRFAIDVQDNEITPTLDIPNVNQLEYREYNYDRRLWGEWEQAQGLINLGKISKDKEISGGRVQIKNLNNMEIRYKWENNKMYFQTNHINHGNITPFALLHNGVRSEIDVLTGLESYKASPVHLKTEEGNLVEGGPDIIIPNPEQETPGSNPGIKIEFKRPRELDRDRGEFVSLEESKAKNFDATLDLGLNNEHIGQLKFSLGNDSDVSGLGQSKNMVYRDGIYTLYLAQDIEDDKVFKWGELDRSLILSKVELSLSNKNKPEGQGRELGKFQPGEPGHTYLGYTIKRSSMEEAYMEIQPYSYYKNTEFTYTVWSSSDGDNWESIVEHKHFTKGGGKENTFTIPVPFSSRLDNQYYKVEVKYSGGNQPIKSQVLHYKPAKDETIPPPTPIIQSINNIYAVPPRDLGKQPEAIGFDLTWSAPKNTSQDELLDRLLSKGSIYYEIFLHDDLESTNEQGSLIEVVKVSLEGNEIRVSFFDDESSIATQGAIGYDPGKGTFTIENIVLKNPGVAKWEQIKLQDDEEGYKYPDASREDSMAAKEVPGIYYITMRARYEVNNSEDRTPMGVSNTSNPESITISLLEEVVPVPTKIESKHFIDDNNDNEIGQSLSWENVSIYRYIRQMLAPLNISVDGDSMGVYELYLYQAKNIKESKLEDAEPVIEDLDVERSYKLSKEDIENLRSGEVIRLDYKGLSSDGMSTIVLEGLDPNQVYYTKIRLRLDLKDSEDNKIEVPRYSVFSKEHSFTSYIKPNEPEPGERVPPVPEDLEIVDQPNNTTAKIGWKAPEYTKQDDEDLYYEVLRIDSRLLAKEEDSRLFPIEKLIKADKKNQLHGWRTMKALVEEYDKSSNKWIDASPQQASNKLQLEDDNLKPNEIYYYYVRTVLVIEGEKVYSSWVGIPVTTDPIRKPINLKVEHEDDYWHDTKREIVISFLAPIPKESKVPADYDFDIAVLGELDDEYRLDYPVTRLKSKEDNDNIPTGYQHFVYRIKDVRPGKRYSIKVRTVDKTKDMVNNQYPKSLYSGRVTTRTEFDQEEQDKEDKFVEYLKYFEDKVEVLRRKPYWILEDSNGNFTVKYRSNYINSQISSSKNYKLISKDKNTKLTYYMPASVVANSNLRKTSFQIEHGGMTYSIRPSTITSELEELKETLREIDNKRIDDYYIAFTFSQSPNTGSFDVLTDDIIVDTNLVRLRQDDLFIDDDIMIALNREIDKQTKYYINDLEKAIDRGKIRDEDLDIIVNRSISEIERKHEKEAKRIVDRATNKIVPINNWKNTILIMASFDGRASATGYKKGWIDEAIPTFNVSGGYGIEINEPGIYVFKGQKINIPVIPEIGDTGDLIAKYQLTDFFGINGHIDPNANVSKRDVFGAMARVLGAPRGADYTQYLRQKGINGVNSIAMDLPLKKGEGIYLVMQVYEKVHKRPINSVYIKNRGAVPNLHQFNQMHRPYVLVAVDSKFISQGSGIRPNDPIKTKEVLQMLDTIMKVIR